VIPGKNGKAERKRKKKRPLERKGKEEANVALSSKVDESRRRVT